MSGLNPYSIGIWSATMAHLGCHSFASGLNPYSIGIWSATDDAAAALSEGKKS